MIRERRPPIKELHQVTSQPQQKHPHRKNEQQHTQSNTVTEIPEAFQMSEPKDDDETIQDHLTHRCKNALNDLPQFKLPLNQNRNKTKKITNFMLRLKPLINTHFLLVG